MFVFYFPLRNCPGCPIDIVFTTFRQQWDVMHSCRWHFIAQLRAGPFLLAISMENRFLGLRLFLSNC